MKRRYNKYYDTIQVPSLLAHVMIIIIIYFQILKLHMVLFKLEMIQANTKLFFTEKRNHTNKSNTIKLP